MDGVASKPLIPVIDILNGVVVHAVKGQRDRYRRLTSALVDSCDPSLVLKALIERLHPKFVYVADLDGILNRQVNRCVLAELTQQDVGLIVDAGARSLDDVEGLLELDVAKVVLPTETLSDFAVVSQCVANFGAKQLLGGLDLVGGVPSGSCCDGLTAEQTAQQFFEAGLADLLVLDLAAVGAGQGIPTLALCEVLKHSGAETIITGGGVREPADIAEATAMGVDGVLVASALHTGNWPGC